MKTGTVEIDAFRAWLAKNVRTTVWYRFGSSRALAEEWGAKLGVAPEILMEAHALFKREDAKSPYRKLHGIKKSHKDAPQIHLLFPPEVWDVWHDACERLCMKSSQLFRGLVNAYLQSDWEPQTLQRRWVWKGKICKVENLAYVNYARQEQTLVSRGALEAIRVRAQRQRVPMAVLLRGIVLEFLEGRVVPVPVDARRMYESPARYLEGT